MKNKITCALFFLAIFAFSLICIFLPKDGFSLSERRVLASFPEINAEKVFSGKFSEGFEDYSTDNFPFRDSFRAIKADFSRLFLGKRDNNGLFLQNGHLSKLEYPLSDKLLRHATERFSFIYDAFLKGSAENIYLSVIPDKNYFLDTLKLDYAHLVNTVKGDMPWAQYIDIFPLLALSDYYTTDSHWKQECILPVAEKLLSEMGKTPRLDFTENVVDAPFFGVYSGQSAIETEPDTIKYLTNDTLSSCIVKKYDSGRAEPAFMYDTKKATSRDPYELFLSGGSALITIENPENKSGGHLIVFRDSFGSSIVPLICGQYSKTTVVDIRYIPSEMLGQFITDFDGADVLFLYSASMLNSSGAMR